MDKDRTDIALSIATELLEQDALDVNNFEYEADSLRELSTSTSSVCYSFLYPQTKLKSCFRY